MSSLDRVGDAPISSQQPIVGEMELCACLAYHDRNDAYRCCWAMHLIYVKIAEGDVKRDYRHEVLMKIDKRKRDEEDYMRRVEAEAEQDGSKEDAAVKDEEVDESGCKSVSTSTTSPSFSKLMLTFCSSRRRMG